MSSADALVLDAETWSSELLSDLPPEQRALLDDADKEIIFDALVAFAETVGAASLKVEREGADSGISADAPWLVPRTRIHVRAGASARDLVKRLVKMVVVASAAGSVNPKLGIVTLTVDVVQGILERTSRLDDVDYEIVRTLLELAGSMRDGLPTETDVERALPDVDDLAARLDSLKTRNVIAGDSRGWRLVF